MNKSTCKKSLYIGLMIVFLAVSNKTCAQQNCTQSLREARNAYQEGRLQDLPNMLNACISKGFSKDQKIEALRLVTLAYLYQEDEKAAEDTYLKLLQTNPEYRPNENADPAEYIILHNKFDTESKFYYGIKLGAAYNLVQILAPTKDIRTDLNPGVYSFSMTLAGGIFFQLPIKDEWSLSSEFHFMTRNLSLVKSPAEGSSLTADQTITEQHSWLQMPVLLNYRLYDKRTKIELTAGPAFHYLLEATLSTEGAGININNFRKLDRRNVFNLSAMVGATAHIKSSGTPFLSFGLMYQHRLLNEVNYNTADQATYTPTEYAHLTDSYYGDGEFKGHSLWLQVGLRIPYYKPQLK